MILAFSIGFLTGVIATVVYATFAVSKENKKQDKLLEDMKKDVDLVLSVKKRFTEVTKITERQMELLAGAERPSASALHSKHQNSIIGELKKLEEEKVNIFRSILKDGLDPELSIIVDGKPTMVKMSKAVSMYESNHQNVDKTESKNPRVKLRLVTHEEEDVLKKELPKE